ncbi:MAG: DUF1800 domain-containing protein, partial [Planctomycetes bacterium]|nr:DUF1800 domain-containing protein [Planctomycetota bacterium]
MNGVACVLLLVALLGGCGGGAAPLPLRVLTLRVVSGPTKETATVPIAGGEWVEVAGGGADLFLDGVAHPFERLAEGRLRFRAPPVPLESAVRVRSGEGEAELLFTQEFSLDPAPDALTAEQARHLLQRTGFGASPARIDRAVVDGLSRTVTDLLDAPRDAEAEEGALAVYGGELPPAAHLGPRVNQEWWLALMVHSRHPFRERLALALHDHFATSERNFQEQARWFVHGHVELLRSFADAYDWRELVVGMAKDRAMLEWLDGRHSTREAPNENFARELFELFLLGEGNGYTEEDVREASRALTGFFVYGTRGQGDPDGHWEVRYQPRRHDAGEKRIFGVPGHFGYDDIAPFYESRLGEPDAIFGQTDPSVRSDPRDGDGGIVALTLRERPHEAALHLARRLCEEFLYPEPGEEMLGSIAQGILDAEWGVRPALERLLGSKAFFSRRARLSRAGGPIEYAVGFLRSTGLDRGAVIPALRHHLEAMGQVPLDPPDVAGWPSGTAWFSAQSAIERVRFVGRAVATFGDPWPVTEPDELAWAARLLGIDLEQDLASSTSALCHAYAPHHPRSPPPRPPR